jgi:uncharacterized protein YegP (UPF0339 family)
MIRTVALLVALGVAASTAGLDSAAAQDKKAKDKAKTEAASPATFEVYKDKGGKFRFRLVGGDGVELAMSHRGYEAKADIQKVIDIIKRDAAKAKVTEEK